MLDTAVAVRQNGRLDADFSAWEFAARFWARVDVREPDQCWPWRLAPDSSGYGQFKYRQQHYRAHQVAFFLANGRWPDDSVLHSCDTPLCCNPYHLRDGTHRENMRDAAVRGRRRGERNGRSVLTEALVVEMRRRHANGEGGADLAREFKVSKYAVYQMLGGATWKHLL